MGGRGSSSGGGGGGWRGKLEYDKDVIHISSQRYLDEDVVESKMEQIKDLDVIEIPYSDVGEIDGKSYAIMVDKHHTFEAAKRLNKKIRFVINSDSEGLTGDALLEARYIDSSYYNVLTGKDV